MVWDTYEEVPLTAQEEREAQGCCARVSILAIETRKQGRGDKRQINRLFKLLLCC